MEPDAPIWGLALGSGSARGWAHVGVIRALGELGIEPRVVAGSSAGAMVGAAWAARRLDIFERWIRSLRRRDVFSFLDISLGGSLIKGERLYQLFDRYRNLRIESLSRSFAAVATDFETGERCCFTSGSVIDAVRASMSMPGLLPPVRLDGRWLVDGGLSDPIPVELCRQLGATRVIAVNLNRGIVEAKASRQLAEQPENTSAEAAETCEETRSAAGDGPREALAGAFAAVGDRLEELRSRLSNRSGDAPEAAGPDLPKTQSLEASPGLYDMMIGALHILQDRVARVTLEQHPPDLELCPRLGQIAMLEVYRAEEAIAEGRRVTLEAADQLRALQ